jgi:hypothetical protein
MSFEEFIKLDEDNRYVAWMALSVEVAHFKNFYYSFHLYQIGSFYIQLTVMNNNNKKMKLEAFDNVNRLDPYLQHIDLVALTGA